MRGTYLLQGRAWVQSFPPSWGRGAGIGVGPLGWESVPDSSPRSVTLGKSPNPSVPQFPYLENGRS